MRKCAEIAWWYVDGYEQRRDRLVALCMFADSLRGQVRQEHIRVNSSAIVDEAQSTQARTCKCTEHEE